jgi:hypothetical protein
MKQLPVLKDWSLFLDPISKSYRLSGEIYHDPKNRFKNGEKVTTTYLKNIDFENRLAQTRNTTYCLSDM